MKISYQVHAYTESDFETPTHSLWRKDRIADRTMWRYKKSDGWSYVKGYSYKSVHLDDQNRWVYPTKNSAPVTINVIDLFAFHSYPLFVDEYFDESIDDD